MAQTTVIPISLPKKLAQQLDRAAKTRAMNRSEFVRAMIRRELYFQAVRELQQETAPRASKAGVHTLDDAVRAVTEIRKGRK